MARRAKGGDEVATTAREMIQILRDLCRDLEVFAEGRGSPERFWVIRAALWRCERQLETLDPDRRKEIHTALALTHKTSVSEREP